MDGARMVPMRSKERSGVFASSSAGESSTKARRTWTPSASLYPPQSPWFQTVGMLEQRLLDATARPNTVQDAAQDKQLKSWQKKCEQWLRILRHTGQLPQEGMNRLATPIDPALFYKSRYVVGNLLHVAVWMDSPEGKSATGTRGGNTEALLKAKANPKANPESRAHYTDRRKRKTTLQAIHIAAGLDSVEAMSALLAAVKDKVPEGENRAEHIAQLVNAHTMLDGARYYTPLHEATYLNRKDAVIWLLENHADPATEHLEGITPMHMLAWKGHKHDEALEEMIQRLLEREPRLLSMNTCTDGLFPADLTPLELATKSGSQFPRRMLYLLASSLHCKNDAHNFIDDLKTLSKHSMESAVELTSRVRSSERAQLEGRRKWLRENFLHYNTHDIAYLFFIAPVAAAEFLKILTVLPKVEEPGRHPMPSRTLLREPDMRCTYQTDSEWKWDVTRTTPENVDRLYWHYAFMPDPEDYQGSGPRSNIKDVLVKVVLMPNLLHIDILWALSICPHDCVQVFEALPVQGAITCLWDAFTRKAFYLNLLFRCIDMLVFLLLSITSATHPFLSARLCAFALAGILRELAVSICWTLTFVVKAWMLSEIWNLRHVWFKTRALAYGLVMNVLKVAALWMTWQMDTGHADESGDVHVRELKNVTIQHAVSAASVILMACMVVDSLQVCEGIGAKIFTLQRSLLTGAMVEMLGLMFIFFVTFFFAFYIMHLDDPDDDGYRWAWVWTTLYRAILFGDGDGLDAGLAVDNHEDQMQPSRDHGVSGCLMMFATFLSYVVMLNLIIAVYANEYDAAEQESIVFFMRERVRASCYLVLALQKIGPKQKVLRRAIRVTIPLLFVLGFAVLHYSYDLAPGVFAAVCIAGGQVLWQMVYLCPKGQPSLNPVPCKQVPDGVRKRPIQENDETKQKLRDYLDKSQLRHGGQSLVQKWLERKRKDRETMPRNDYYVWICHRADFHESRFHCGGRNMWLDKKVDTLQVSLEKNFGRRFDHVEERLLKLEQMQGTLDEVHRMLCRQSEREGDPCPFKPRERVDSKDSGNEDRSSDAAQRRQPYPPSYSAPPVAVTDVSRRRRDPDSLCSSPKLHESRTQGSLGSGSNPSYKLPRSAELQTPLEAPGQEALQWAAPRSPRGSPRTSQPSRGSTQTLQASRASTQDRLSSKDSNDGRRSTDADSRRGLSPASPHAALKSSWDRPAGKEPQEKSNTELQPPPEQLRGASFAAGPVSSAGPAPSTAATSQALEESPAVRPSNRRRLDFGPLRAAVDGIQAFKIA